jgi:hypothetical protein
MNYTQQKLTDYDGFVEKFKPKKTTDDCYTPQPVYDAVLEWVRDEYGIASTTPILRPFKPGGDYENETYPDDCIVVDNPPFSILTKIIRYYLAHDVHYFLFAPTLVNFSADIPRNHHVITGATITYANGAKVNTSFMTGLGDTYIRSAPELYRTVTAADKLAQTEKKKHLQKYSYPDELLTASKVAYLSHHDVDFTVSADECLRVSRLDAQPKGKGVFGSGYLLSPQATKRSAAAQQAAAQQAAAQQAAEQQVEQYRFTLSDRERELTRHLG